MEIISADPGMQFNSTEFQGKCQTHSVHVVLVAPEHQEINVQVKVIWRKLHTILHSLMVYARFLEAHIHFILIYKAYHIFPLLPTKDLINKDDNPTTPFKLATCMKPSVSYLSVIFFPCAVQKATVHVGTKALNMRHQEQKGFHGIFVGITEHQKGYLFM